MRMCGDDILSAEKTPCSPSVEKIGDWSVASELFLKSGQPLRAAEITIKGKGEGWQDALAVIVR